MDKNTIFEEMDELLQAAKKDNLEIRLLGGLAVNFHCPSAQTTSLKRSYPDIDIVVSKKGKNKLKPFFSSVGYEPDKNFNLLNGDRRQLFVNSITGRRVDVFVGDFEMCHKLPLRNRLEHHPVTIPLAELFLTKIQIVEINQKDALDVISLLMDNQVVFCDRRGINLDRIVRLCLKDWGLYKTLIINLEKIETILMEQELALTSAQKELVLRRINLIRRTLNRVNKPILWMVRNSVGTRIRWYAEVEEVDR